MFDPNIGRKYYASTGNIDPTLNSGSSTSNITFFQYFFQGFNIFVVSFFCCAALQGLLTSYLFLYFDNILSSPSFLSSVSLHSRGYRHHRLDLLREQDIVLAFRSPYRLALLPRSLFGPCSSLHLVPCVTSGLDRTPLSSSLCTTRSQMELTLEKPFRILLRWGIPKQ